MGIVEDAEKKAEDWVLKEEMPVAVQAGASAVVGFLASGKAAAVLATLGITIDPTKLGSTLITYGTLLATAALTHLVASWGINKATAPKPTTDGLVDASTMQTRVDSLLKATASLKARTSLELEADKLSPLAPKDTEAPLK